MQLQKRNPEKSNKKELIDETFTWWHIIWIFLMVVIFASMVGFESREKQINDRISVLNYKLETYESQFKNISTRIGNLNDKSGIYESQFADIFVNIYTLNDLFERLNSTHKY